MDSQRFIENLHGEAAFQGFAIEEILFQGSSQYQSINIVQTSHFGRVLILDGIVQTTQMDEFMYHEMLVHVPMFANITPYDVLIIGGGDGGALREVLKHDINRVDMIEIDRLVVEKCIEYLPTLNNSGIVFEDPRANLIIEDAFTYLNRERQRYDVIVCDSTDPIGAGEILFSREFYALCERSLKPHGTMSFQDGVVFFQPSEARDTRCRLHDLGLLAKAYQIAVPSYYGGSMLLTYAARRDSEFTPSLDGLRHRLDALGDELRHYNPAHHLASFCLPNWIENVTGGCSAKS